MDYVERRHKNLYLGTNKLIYVLSGPLYFKGLLKKETFWMWRTF